jgi:hypothetical protein
VGGRGFGVDGFPLSVVGKVKRWGVRALQAF